MQSFKRLFKYIRPQWPRIIVVVLSAVIVSTLLSLSFMTVIPLLKVMMGREGLHGWIDRKACGWKYGVDFYVVERDDFIYKSGQDIAHHLIVTDVRKNSLADLAALKPMDKIVGVGNFLVSPQVPKMPFPTLIEELATTGEITVKVQVEPENKNEVEYKTLKLNTPANKAVVGSLQWGPVRRAEWKVKIAVIKRAQQAISLLPRQQTQANTTKAVVFIILLIGVVTVIRCVAKFYQGYLAQKVVHVAINRLREDTFAHVMHMPTGFFAVERPSDTVSRIIHDTSIMGKAIKTMLGKALREPLNALFLLGFAMWLSWSLTTVFLCGAPLILGLLMIFGRKMKRATTKSLMAGSQMLGKLQETMSALKVVKVYNRQQTEKNNFMTINKRLLKQLLKISKIDAATSPVMEVLGMAAGGMAIVFGAHWVAAKQIDPAEFLVLIVLLGVAAEAVRKTSDIWNRIQEANAAAERVFGIIDELPEFEKHGAIELPPLKYRIEFKDVVFTYPGSDEPVLKGINLSVKAGQTVAIVGPNGSGKTTLVNLLPRFYNVDSGSILIDGRDISESTLSSLRKQIGMVTQNVVTFNDTIAANIGYGKHSATLKEITAAAKRSFAHEFIEPLPEGYATIIGEYGAGLSGGQLQRIVIARAILKDPAILIFDEATSQVDADSEAKIHKALAKLMHDRTTFIIAHRFSTVISADVIVVMDDGRIIAGGQHDELIKRCGLYQSLYETQLITSE